MSAELTPSIQRFIDAAASREMAETVLLFLAGHRPLAFVAGQALCVLSPVASLVGVAAVGEWSAILSDPHGPGLLADALEARQTNLHDGGRDQE